MRKRSLTWALTLGWQVDVVADAYELPPGIREPPAW